MKPAEKLTLALTLLAEITAEIETAPANWWRRYYTLTKAHMILTDSGWEPGANKTALIEEAGEDAVLEEINAPGPELAGFPGAGG